MQVNSMSSSTCNTRALLVVALLLIVSCAAQSQTQSQSTSEQRLQSVTIPGHKQQSLASTLTKASAKKNRAKAKHVYTNDDFERPLSLAEIPSLMPVNADPAANTPPYSTGNDETYWRGRARVFREQIAALDQQIDNVTQEIAKSGPTAFDPTTGLTQNVIVVHDRNAELRQLQWRRQNLEQQIDDLADEGRRAGADPGWFR
jgi:hypothetical protein